MTDRYRIHPDVAWRQVDGIVFLLTSDSRYHQIADPVGVSAWQAIAAAPRGTGADRDDLTAKICTEFEVGRDVARGDLGEFLDKLVRAQAAERMGPRHE